MADIKWTTYYETMKEHLGGLPLEKRSEWKGAGSIMETGTAEKFQKTGTCVITVGDSLHYGFCAAFPAEGYDLPIFLSRWEEKPAEITFLVDLVPTVDTMVDEAYRKKYIETIDPVWQKYESLAGICPEEHDGLRSILSIIYTAARMPIEREGMRLAALAPHTEYLKIYLEFYKAASPVHDAVKLQEIKRKTASVKKMLHGCFMEAFSGQIGHVLGSAQAQFLSIFI